MGADPRQAWEFKHPEFNQHKKDNLDNIRRKAPAPRKMATVEEPSSMAVQQANLINDSLAATQHQVQTLQEQYMQVSNNNRILVEEVRNLQRLLIAQKDVTNEIIAHLCTADERRRNSRHSAQSSHSGHPGQFLTGAMAILPDSADEPAAELRRAREILNAIATNAAADSEFEKLAALYQSGTSPPESATSSVMFSAPSSAALPLASDALADMKHVVYPVGQTQGIDPFHADHINNIPYARPPSNPNDTSQITPPPTKDAGGSLWGSRQPSILLVEDDKICARIGSKFLTQGGCAVDTAVSDSKGPVRWGTSSS